MCELRLPLLPVAPIRLAWTVFSVARPCAARRRLRQVSPDLAADPPGCTHRRPRRWTMGDRIVEMRQKVWNNETPLLPADTRLATAPIGTRRGVGHFWSWTPSLRPILPITGRRFGRERAMETGQRARCVPWHLQMPWLGQGLLLPRALSRGGPTPHSRGGSQGKCASAWAEAREAAHPASEQGYRDFGANRSLG